MCFDCSLLTDKSSVTLCVVSPAGEAEIYWAPKSTVHCTQNYWLKVRFLLYLRENIAALTECTKLPLYHPPPLWGGERVITRRKKG